MTEPGPTPSVGVPETAPRGPAPSVPAFLAGLAAALAAEGVPAIDLSDPPARAGVARVRAMLGRAFDREPRPGVGERVFLRAARLALSPGPGRAHPALRALLASAAGRAPSPGTPFVAEAVDAYLGRAPAVTAEPRGEPAPAARPALPAAAEAVLSRCGAALARLLGTVR